MEKKTNFLFHCVLDKICNSCDKRDTIAVHIDWLLFKGVTSNQPDQETCALKCHY